MVRMENLEQIHGQMRELERKRKENDRKLRELYDKTSPIRDHVVKDVCLETDVHGKRIYSNQTLRRAEFNIRLSENEEYQRLVKEIKSLREKNEEVNFEYNRLLDKRDLLLGVRSHNL